MRKRWLITFWAMTLVLVLLPVLLMAQEKDEIDLTGTLDLPLLVSYVIQNNPELASLRKQVEAADSKIPQAKALDDPMVEIEIDSIPIDTIDLSDAMQIKYKAFQRIPFKGKLPLQGEVASKNVQSMREMLSEKEKEIVSKVKKLYYQLYLINKSVLINRDNKKIMNEFEEIARTKYAVGEGSQQDILKAQVELSSLDSELIGLEQELGSAKAELNMLLNRRGISSIGLPPDFDPRQFGFTLDCLQKTALEKRPLLLSFQNIVGMNETSLDLSKKQYFPDFSTGVSYNQTFMGKDRWSLMVAVNIPLWHKKRQAYGVIEAESNLLASMAEYESAKNMVLYEVRDAFLKASSNFKKIELYKNGIIPQAEQSLKAAIAEYKTNLIDFLALLDSWRSLIRFWSDYYSLLAQYQQNLSDLERAVGVELSDLSGEQR